MLTTRPSQNWVHAAPVYHDHREPWHISIARLS
jgi:hypothetical protein